MTSPAPITDAELHAFADGQLAEPRAREVERHLADHPEDARRVAAWETQKQGLKALFDGVADEAVPARLQLAARGPSPWTRWRLAASVGLVLLGGSVGWALHGEVGRQIGQRSEAPQAARSLEVDAFAQRAAVAHAVYVPDQRRPVEIGGDHADQLVAWLSKRTGVRIQAPNLLALGYRLEGGRLLPGGQAPVAQFMYQDEAGLRLTLYVSNEIPRSVPDRQAGGHRPAETAFRFAREGAVNTFFWVDGSLGYAMSSYAGRQELERVSSEVYRQLEGGG